MFCAHRIKMGKIPACAEGCTRAGMKAIYFGDINEDVITNGEEVLKLSQVIEKRHGFRYNEELGTQPRVYYLPAGEKHRHKRK